MARLPFVDAHLHLWDRERLRYPWLDDPAMESIAKSYVPDDYRAEAAAWNIIGCIHVEAGADPADSRNETLWLQELRSTDTDQFPTAIVAHVPLHAPDADRQLEWQASRGGVCGIRHIVNWHPDSSRRAYPHDLTQDADWQQGYALMARHGLSYDFHGHPPQLGHLAKVAARHDQVPLIINHLGLPSLADGLDLWRAGLKALAALPQVSIKISGAGFIASPFKAAHYRDIILEAVELFTPQRAMIASNFPTDRLFASMNETLSSYEQLFADFSEDDRRDLWGRTANRVYQLGLDI
jgi:predicted TIM-barrel fold metal-dependent hydrolase